MNVRRLNRKIDLIIKEYEDNKFPVFCVTGKMASGKNFICDIFSQKNFFCVDFDDEVHKIIEEKNDEIVRTFLPEAQKNQIDIQDKNGKINTRALGALLFSYPELLSKQEKIIYPALSEKTKELIKKTKASGAYRGIVLNAAVMYKTPSILNKCDLVVYVDSFWIKRFNRARKRDRISEIEILQRFTAQKNLLDEYKNAGCTITVIKN